MNKSKLEQIFAQRAISSHDNYKMLCPFHDETTPSFLIHKEEGIAHCFGCGVSGSIEVLVNTLHPEISLSKARELLDIDIFKHKGRKINGPYIETGPPETFPESWLAAWPKEIHVYTTKRGLRPSILQRAQVRYDPVRKRQVFPHRNRRGDLIGAAGRSCSGENPKWYFYWAYRKGSALYTPFTDRETSRALYLTEGIFDCLKIAQADGSRRVAAILGSKAGRGQIAELKEYEEVVLCLDNDEAGKAAQEALYLKLRKSCQVSFINLPSHANDWMDLKDEEVGEVLSSKANFIQSKKKQLAL